MWLNVFASNVLVWCASMSHGKGKSKQHSALRTRQSSGDSSSHVADRESISRASLRSHSASSSPAAMAKESVFRVPVPSKKRPSLSAVSKPTPTAASRELNKVNRSAQINCISVVLECLQRFTSFDRRAVRLRAPARLCLRIRKMTAGRSGPRGAVTDARSGVL